MTRPPQNYKSQSITPTSTISGSISSLATANWWRTGRLKLRWWTEATIEPMSPKTYQSSSLIQCTIQKKTTLLISLMKAYTNCSGSKINSKILTNPGSSSLLSMSTLASVTLQRSCGLMNTLRNTSTWLLNTTIESSLRCSAMIIMETLGITLLTRLKEPISTTWLRLQVWLWIKNKILALHGLKWMKQLRNPLVSSTNSWI